LASAGVLWPGARAARREQGAAPWPDWTEKMKADGVRVLLYPAGAVFLVVGLAAAAGPFVPGLRALFGEPLLSSQAAARFFGVGLVCFWVAARPCPRLSATSVVVGAVAASEIGRLVSLWQSIAPGSTLDLFGRPVPAAALQWGVIGAELVLAAAIWLLKDRIYKRFFSPAFLGATEYRTLIALSDVLVMGPERAIEPPQVARNTDHHLARITAKRKWVQRLAIRVLQAHPALYVKAPLSELDEQGRLEHLKKHFQADALLPFIPDLYRRFIQAMIRIGQQVTYVGYYNDPRTYETIGYQVFEDRPRAKELKAKGVLPPVIEPLDLKVHLPDDAREVEECDICIIGSGAAGGTLAYHLAQHGHHVIVLERGKYTQPHECTPDEVEMMGKLYSDGVFQQTEDFRFTVLQGSAVGGSTVVNNAVSFRTPAPVLARWNGALRAGIGVDEYLKSTKAVEDWLYIRPQTEGTEFNKHNLLNRSFPKYLDGVKKLGLGADQLEVSVVNANVQNCLGCGYCNIGCRYGAKLSMLTTAFPWAQQRFGAERVRIFAEAPVKHIVTDGKRATEAIAELPDGRRVRVKAKTFVLAAGTIASSYLLQRSRIGRGLPVGRNVSFNMGHPVTAEFDDVVDAFDGLQISHFGRPQPQRGWVYETWYNPPVSQAVNMPGWFEEHYQNMRRYNRLMAVGVLVGTERNAWVGKAVTGGAAIHYAPTQGDRRKLADGLMELGQILLAAGARRVMLNGWQYLEFTSANALAAIPAIAADPYQLTLGTGHPQGGNAISADPSLGVVDPNFRVHGYSNLFVCDASVFPSSLTVNPQETVMALAHYAAPRIHDSRP
jgi:choline dehydrogenase-like flavoprotein